MKRGNYKTTSSSFAKTVLDFVKPAIRDCAYYLHTLVRRQCTGIARLRRLEAALLFGRHMWWILVCPTSPYSVRRTQSHTPGRQLLITCMYGHIERPEHTSNPRKTLRDEPCPDHGKTFLGTTVASLDNCRETKWEDRSRGSVQGPMPRARWRRLRSKTTLIHASLQRLRLNQQNEEPVEATRDLRAGQLPRFSKAPIPPFLTSEPGM